MGERGLCMRHLLIGLLLVACSAEDSTPAQTHGLGDTCSVEAQCPDLEAEVSDVGLAVSCEPDALGQKTCTFQCSPSSAGPLVFDPAAKSACDAKGGTCKSHTGSSETFCWLP